LRPATAEEAASALRDCSQQGRKVRLSGAGTKAGASEGDAEPISSLGLDRVLEHNSGDFTAVLEAGVRLADAQALFAREGQMLAWDPPDGGATVGGVIASADSGPLRHRYGGVRDLVVGITVALSDGTVAKSGGKVIKNVAGYDVAKLFAGSEGTLGLIVSVAVRLHPRPAATATVAGATDDPELLGRAAIALSHAPVEADCLDARWSGGSGRLLLRFAGATAERQAETVAERLRAAGLQDVGPAGEEVWDEQRSAQRGAVKIPYLPTELPRLIREAGSLVARAGLGVAWVPPGTVAPPPIDPGANLVMRRLKARFDPAGILV
jgi:glycolate oxidase FAD binding subunit